MEGSTELFDALICSGARRLTGFQRRLFMAEVATELCDGSARQAERRFGWGRETVEKGLYETRQGMRCLENFAAPGRQRSEEKNPQFAADIRAFVDPHTYADPELKSSRRYTNLSAAEVREALINQGHSEKELPSERTMRDILNRMNDSPVFRRDYRWAARRHRLSSRRNSGPLDETGQSAPSLRRRVGSQVAIADATWGIVSRPNGCCQPGLKIEGNNLKRRPDMQAKDRWLI